MLSAFLIAGSATYFLLLSSWHLLRRHLLACLPGPTCSGKDLDCIEVLVLGESGSKIGSNLNRNGPNVRFRFKVQALPVPESNTRFSVRVDVARAYLIWMSERSLLKVLAPKNASFLKADIEQDDHWHAGLVMFNLAMELASPIDALHLNLVLKIL
ncbi:hypothetical protein FB451DRAFT_1183392 [Mycena latifolia]|nr:hypothetical protein FB451DRAFT_1183392 [Mycena latifolia]